VRPSACAAGAAKHGAAGRAGRRPWQRGRRAAGVCARGGAAVRPGRGARRPPLRAASPWPHAGSSMALWPKIGAPMEVQESASTAAIQCALARLGSNADWWLLVLMSLLAMSLSAADGRHQGIPCIHAGDGMRCVNLLSGAVAARAAGWRSPQRGGSSESAGASAPPLFGGCALTVASSLRPALARRLYGHSAALKVDAPHTVSHMKARYAWCGRRQVRFPMQVPASR